MNLGISDVVDLGRRIHANEVDGYEAAGAAEVLRLSERGRHCPRQTAP